MTADEQQLLRRSESGTWAGLTEIVKREAADQSTGEAHDG